MFAADRNQKSEWLLRNSPMEEGPQVALGAAVIHSSQLFLNAGQHWRWYIELRTQLYHGRYVTPGILQIGQTSPAGLQTTGVRMDYWWRENFGIGGTDQYGTNIGFAMTEHFGNRGVSFRPMLLIVPNP